jgi:hypothetical protein
MTTAQTTVQTQSDMMLRLGITEVSVPNFLYGDFRYTNLNDALAQAERDKASGITRKPR